MRGASQPGKGRAVPYHAGLADEATAPEHLNRVRNLTSVTLSFTALATPFVFANWFAFGPRFGVALTIAIALSAHHGIDKPYAFNRKEVKDHGEGGGIVGADVDGKVLIVDDVITAGTAIREAVDIIAAEGATTAAILIALDRQEKGRAELSAIQEVQSEFGVAVHSIITMADLIAYIETDPNYGQYLDAMRAYREQYGI